MTYLWRYSKYSIISLYLLLGLRTFSYFAIAVMILVQKEKKEPLNAGTKGSLHYNYDYYKIDSQ